MGRIGATSPQDSRATRGGLAVSATPDARWPFGVKGIVVAVVGVALLAVVVLGVTRETMTTTAAVRAPSDPSPTAAATAPARAAIPPQPALTRAEEVYIQALWPIHGDVERSALRVSLGNILYKTNELDRAELKARVDAALATYRQAEARIAALEPPPSLAREHEAYLAAVRLFEKGALEQMKMFDDGSDEHLLVAFPLSREGGDKIREIGVRFWKDEFPPH